MPNDPLLFYLIVGIILIIIVLGILIWAIVSIATSSTGKKDRKQTAHTAQAKESETSSKSLPSARSSSQALGRGTKDTELLRVFRNMSTGAIYIEIDGKQYHQLTDVHDPQTGRLLLQTVVDLGRFTRGVTPAVQTKTSPASAERQTQNASLLQPKEKQTPKPSDRGSLARRGEALISNPQSTKNEPGATPPPTGGLLERAHRISEDSTPAEKTSDSGSKQTPEKAAPISGPKLSPKRAKEKIDMGSFWGRAFTTPSIGTGVAGPRPLADELEDILKDLIDSAPERPPRDVHFRTATDGSLIIEVDGTSFQNVGEIKDPVAQQIIKTVIEKWEKK